MTDVLKERIEKLEEEVKKIVLYIKVAKRTLKKYAGVNADREIEKELRKERGETI